MREAVSRFSQKSESSRESFQCSAGSFIVKSCTQDERLKTCAEIEAHLTAMKLN